MIPRVEDAELYVVNPFVTGKFTWTGQANVNNVSDTVDIISANYRFTRYNDPRQIIFTSTLSF